MPSVRTVVAVVGSERFPNCLAARRRLFTWETGRSNELLRHLRPTARSRGWVLRRSWPSPARYRASARSRAIATRAEALKRGAQVDALAWLVACRDLRLSDLPARECIWSAVTNGTSLDWPNDGVPQNRRNALAAAPWFERPSRISVVCAMNCALTTACSRRRSAWS